MALASSGNGNVTFRNLGRGLLWGDNKIDGYREEGKGIAYLPVVHERGILKPFAAPVILYEGGEVRSLRPIYPIRNLSPYIVNTPSIIK